MIKIIPGIYHYKFRGTYEIPTNAEMLQSEDDGMVFTSCSLSRSQAMIEEFSPDAY